MENKIDNLYGKIIIKIPTIRTSIAKSIIKYDEVFCTFFDSLMEKHNRPIIV